MIGLVVNAARYFFVMSRYFYRYKFRDAPFDELVQILNTENFGKNKKEITFNRSIFSWLLFSVSHSLEGKKTKLVSFISLAILLIFSNVVLVGYSSRGHYSSMLERVFEDRALDSPQRTRLNDLFSLGNKVSPEQACEAMILVLENIDVFDEKPIMQRNLLQMLAINFTSQPFVTFEN